MIRTEQQLSHCQFLHALTIPVGIKNNTTGKAIFYTMFPIELDYTT